MRNLRFILISGLFMACGGPSEEDPRSVKIDSLETRISELQQKNDSLADLVGDQNQKQIDYPAYFDTIPDPENYISKKLKEQQELIPKDPVLGGTMRFTEIEILNDELILAEYEDGHVMGRSIFRYQPDLNGNLEFERVAELQE